MVGVIHKMLLQCKTFRSIFEWPALGQVSLVEVEYFKRRNNNKCRKVDTLISWWVWISYFMKWTCTTLKCRAIAVNSQQNDLGKTETLGLALKLERLGDDSSYIVICRTLNVTWLVAGSAETWKYTTRGWERESSVTIPNALCSADCPENFCQTAMVHKVGNFLWVGWEYRQRYSKGLDRQCSLDKSVRRQRLVKKGTLKSQRV